MEAATAHPDRGDQIGIAPSQASETAVREELIALVLLLMLLVAVELLNSAVERTVDLVSVEEHSLAGRAKDMASAAVFIVVPMAGLSWTVIAGPVALAWIRA